MWSLGERRWYIAGTEGTLIADLVRNKLMFRGAMDKAKPERIEYADRTDDNHNGADQAMAKDLLASLESGAAFPVTRARFDGSRPHRHGDRPRHARTRADRLCSDVGRL